MTMTTGLPDVKWHKSRAWNLLPLESSARMGEPVSTALSSGRSFIVSGKLQQTLVATGIHSLLASPGVISDSWMMQGIFKDAAALTTGTLTNPPFENTIFGFNFRRSETACVNPLTTLKGSEKFLTSKYLLNFPEEMP